MGRHRVLSVSTCDLKVWSIDGRLLYPHGLHFSLEEVFRKFWGERPGHEWIVSGSTNRVPDKEGESVVRGHCLTVCGVEHGWH